jgi:hypothetical protein
MVVVSAARSRPRARTTVGGAVVELLVGACIGIAAASLFVALFGLAVARSFGDAGNPLIAVSAAILAPIAAGTAFARALGAGWRRAASVGGMFVLACFVGFLVPITLEPIGIQQRQPVLLVVFLAAFVVGSVVVALVATFGTSWILGRPDRLRRAATVAAITAVAYLLVALALNALPGWHVGDGSLAMLKVASLSNFAAGLIGGTAAFRSLARRPGGPRSFSDG